MQQQIKEAGLDDRVILKGTVSHEQVLTAMEKASVFVLPCVQAQNGDRDATPNTLLEAMAIEVPVISTRLSAIPEMIDEDQNGLLVEPNDATALTDAITSLYHESEKAERLRKASRAKIEYNYDLFYNVQRFAELLAVSRISRLKPRRRSHLLWKKFNPKKLPWMLFVKQPGSESYCPAPSVAWPDPRASAIMTTS